MWKHGFSNKQYNTQKSNLIRISLIRKNKLHSYLNLKITTIVITYLIMIYYKYSIFKNNEGKNPNKKIIAIGLKKLALF